MLCHFRPVFQEGIKRLLPATASPPFDADIFGEPFRREGGSLAEDHLRVGRINFLAFALAVLFLNGSESRLGDGKMRSF